MQFDVKWRTDDTSSFGVTRVDGDGVLDVLDRFFRSKENIGKHISGVYEVIRDPFLEKMIRRDNEKIRKATVKTKNESDD